MWCYYHAKHVRNIVTVIKVSFLVESLAKKITNYILSLFIQLFLSSWTHDKILKLWENALLWFTHYVHNYGLFLSEINLGNIHHVSQRWSKKICIDLFSLCEKLSIWDLSECNPRSTKSLRIPSNFKEETRNCKGSDGKNHLRWRDQKRLTSWPMKRKWLWIWVWKQFLLERSELDNILIHEV